MLLAFDSGNSNTVMGVFREKELLASWRLSTDANKTADEYGVMCKNLFNLHNIDAGGISRIIISSVVPDLTRSLVEVSKKYFSIEPLVVGVGMKTGLKIRYENPKEVGADRIVNAVAGIEEYGAPLILVDFGTATTFCVINDEKEYLGGAITTGIGIAMDALFTRAAKLPKVALSAPPQAIGRTTVGAMQSGLVYGYAGLVDHMIELCAQELGYAPEAVTVVATGGRSEIICPHCRFVNHLDPQLTLKGLLLLADRNREGHSDA